MHKRFFAQQWSVHSSGRTSKIMLDMLDKLLQLALTLVHRCIVAIVQFQLFIGIDCRKVEVKITFDLSNQENNFSHLSDFCVKKRIDFIWLSTVYIFLYLLLRISPWSVTNANIDTSTFRLIHNIRRNKAVVMKVKESKKICNKWVRKELERGRKNYTNMIRKKNILLTSVRHYS